MDKNMILRELQNLLEAVNEQFDIIKEYEESIPKIEFDLIMENVVKLRETFLRLRQLDEAVIPPDTSREFPNLKTSLPEPSGEHAQHPDPGLPELSEELAPHLNPGIPQSSGEQVKHPLPMKPGFRKEPYPKHQTGTAELELFPAEEPAINKKLKEAREKSLGPRMTRQESFKAAIGINDKFMFLNELFDGNLREYNECIETLSGFKILSQALEYLDLLRRKNNWPAGSAAFRRIKEFVETRY